MLLPALLLVIVYQYIPMVGLVIAFQQFTPFQGWFGSPWVGFDNFRYAFELPGTWQIVWNTVNIAIMKIVAGLAFPIIIALLLNEIVAPRIKRSVQTLIYLPHFLSWVILGGILIDILSPEEGIVGKMMRGMGLEPIFFLGDNKWFPYVLVVTDVWKEFGFNTIVFLAALTAINPSLYEAAVIDGAGRWKQTLYVTLPGMMPVIILLATLSLGNVLNAGFDQVFNLYSPVVYERGDILDTLIYRTGLVDGQYGLSTAFGLLKSFVSFVLIAVSYWLAYRYANYRIF